MFFEIGLEKPTAVLGSEASSQINVFPKMVKLSFKVALSNFNKVSANSFSITCDYAFSSQNNLTYLIPKLEMKSDLVKNVTITPNRIDFLIQK